MNGKNKAKPFIAVFAGLLILEAAVMAGCTYSRKNNNEQYISTEVDTITQASSTKPEVTEATGQTSVTQTGVKDSVVTVETTVKRDDPAENTGELLTLTNISRTEAGLDTIPKLDFSCFKLNQRIEELLQGSLYTDDDMKNGIVEPLFITERFDEPIIGDISIGTNISVVLSILGEPSVRNGDIIVYKTNQYYVCIKGSEKVELVNFAPMPGEYDRDILSSILRALCFENIYLTDYLEMSQNVSGFFDQSGFIHGGGNYAISRNGVKVDTMSGVIEIHNNFEGNLYLMDRESDLSLEYVNTDSIIDDMIWDFQSYALENESFVKNGKPSPSGKYIAKYEWITSMHHYFTIRTVDYSKADYNIYAVAYDFEWINDDYIIYLGMFSNLPSVIRVTDRADEQTTIRLISGVDESDYDYGSNYDYSIEEIKENVIVLRHGKAGDSEEEKALLEIHYYIDENGNFIMKK